MGFDALPPELTTDDPRVDRHFSRLRNDLMNGSLKLQTPYNYEIKFTKLTVTSITFNDVQLIPTVTGGGAAVLPAAPTAYIPMDFLIAGQLFTLYVPGYKL